MLNKKTTPVTVVKSNKDIPVKDVSEKQVKQITTPVTVVPSTNTVKPISSSIWKSKYSSHELIDFDKLKEMNVLKKISYYNAEGIPKTSLDWVPKRD